MSPSYTLVLTSLAFNALIVKVGIITLCLKMSCPVQFLSKPCPYQFHDALSTVNAHYLRPMYLMDASIPIDSQDTTVDTYIRNLCIHPLLVSRSCQISIFMMPAQRHQHSSSSNCPLDLMTKSNCSILIIHCSDVSHFLHIPNHELQFTLRSQWSVLVRPYSTHVSETFRQFIQMPPQSQSTSSQSQFSIIKSTLTPLSFSIVYGHGFSQQFKDCGNHSFAIASQCVLHQYILVQPLLLWCRESTNPSAICLALIERHRLSNPLPRSHHYLWFILLFPIYFLFLFCLYLLIAHPIVISVISNRSLRTLRTLPPRSDIVGGTISIANYFSVEKKKKKNIGIAH
eukprot:320383_1